MLRSLASLIVAASVVACVGETQNAQSPFLGTWNCQLTTSVTVTGQGTAPNTQTTDTITITSTSASALTIQSAAGCTLSAATSGNTATITGNVGTCTQTDTNGSLDITYNGGSLVASGSTFSGNATGAFSGTYGGQPVTGNIASTYSCTK
jgi:hypothetical protein